MRSGERAAVRGHRSDMQPRRLRRLSRVEMLGRRVAVASGLRARLFGLALLPRSRAGPGLLIPRCRRIHTFGMRFALDVYFLDREGRVLRRHQAVGPCRLLACTGAESVLELPVTRCTAQEPGYHSSVPKRR